MGIKVSFCKILITNHQLSLYIMPRYRVSDKELRIGARHEMEHTKSERTARRIARDHLREHPTYYQVLQQAETIMAARERNIKPIRKRPQPTRDRWNIF